MIRKLSMISFALILCLLIGCTQRGTDETGANLAFINSNLQVEDIKVGLSEDDVIQLWGPGEYYEGLGGYFRKYENKQVDLGFSNDSDNDLYGKVSYLEVKNPDFTIFSIRIGERKLEGIEQLKRSGFVIVEPNRDIAVKDEFSIALRGEQRIEYFQIFFNDKDLRDRVY